MLLLLLSYILSLILLCYLLGASLNLTSQFSPSGLISYDIFLTFEYSPFPTALCSFFVVLWCHNLITLRASLSHSPFVFKLPFLCGVSLASAFAL